ncbi:MAG TPA: MoxR family ATPase [Roseateles sp.]|nr:MoxR family ATPase [Roseateles sp.]
MLAQPPASIDATLQGLREQGGYVAQRELATTVFLALRLARPLFLEGEPGTGKTEVAKALAAMLGRPLIRLQCYEGLDLAGAAYEWNYARQMLEIKLAEGQRPREALERELFSRRFLIARPLLQAIDPQNFPVPPGLPGAGPLPSPAVPPRGAAPVPGGEGPVSPPVLLIDELDRADEPFEAFLLELLSEFQLSIPELGLIKAEAPPIVVLTSNRTREIHDAVKRRCLYHWVDFPSAARELEILRLKVPGVEAALARQIVGLVQGLRRMDLYKLPGVAETIEWSRALLELNALVLDPATLNDTLGVLLKYQDDIAKVQGSEAARLLAQVSAEIHG